MIRVFDLISSDPGRPRALMREVSANTVKRRLLTLLLPPLIALLAAGVLLDYINGMAPLRHAYDQSLANAALTIAGEVHRDAEGRLQADEATQIMQALRADQQEDGHQSFFQVRGVGRSDLIGDAELMPAMPSQAGFVYQDSFHHGEGIRVATYRGNGPAGPLTVSVAETLHRRFAASRRIVGSLVLTDVVQLLATVALIWFGVNLGLRPLLRMRDEIASRSPQDLAPLDVSSVPGEVQRVVVAINRLFATVREAAQSQQRFLADAAHQIRTPLAGLKGRLDVLLDQAGVEVSREDLQTLVQSVDRLTHTANQLLALARAEPAAQVSLDVERVDLGELSGDAAERAFDRAVARGLELEVRAEQAMVDGVPWLLRELLDNLIDNAISYTQPGGKVIVTCLSKSGGVQLHVEDNGPGIPSGERTRVRERFYRIAGSPGTGSGLGLAIVDEVARLHRAQLVIDAGDNGRGTRVTLLFAAAVPLEGSARFVF
jgi:two-component system, OmpR family, sensor histidine kinase TctE